MIRSVAYDPVQEILEVEFHAKAGYRQGAVYQYGNFRSSDWEDFRRSRSAGKHFLERIKGNEHLPATKISDPIPHDVEFAEAPTASKSEE